MLRQSKEEPYNNSWPKDKSLSSSEMRNSRPLRLSDLRQKQRPPSSSITQSNNTDLLRFK